MKKIIIYLVILLVGCSHNNSEKNKKKNINFQETDLHAANSVAINLKSNQYYKVNDVDCDVLKSIKKEISYFISDTLKIKKDRNKLSFPLSNGKNLILSDTLTNDIYNDERIEYKYLGYFPSINFYLVQQILWEETYYFLIDIKTGIKTEISGFPKLSPNKEYLINRNEMGGFADNQFGFEIWKLDKNNRQLSFIPTLEQDEWYPIDFEWKSDKTALIKIISIASKDFENMNFENSKDCICKEIEFK